MTHAHTPYPIPAMNPTATQRLLAALERRIRRNEAAYLAATAPSLRRRLAIRGAALVTAWRAVDGLAYAPAR